MPAAQRSLSPEPQADLFGAPEPARPAAYVPKPEHVRSGLIESLAAMRAAQNWPWQGSQLTLKRETVWPYLIRLLPDREEAERWRVDLDAEAARLDACDGAAQV